MKLTPRAYQRAIFDSAMQNGNTLVVLPTGLGKTLISIMLFAEKMKKGRCLFLTPTKPLAKQHFETVKDILELSDKNVALVTGDISPKKRKQEYKTDIVISTPQTVRNDLDKKVLEPDFSLCVVDEAHRAVGDYAYVPIVTTLTKASEKTLILGLTASPGGNKERIEEVLENLKIKNIEIRTHYDSDVAPYVQKSSIKFVQVMLSPTLKAIKQELDKITKKYTRLLACIGIIPPIKHKGKFLALRQRIMNIKSGIKYNAMVNYSVLLHALHMSELLETQGVYPLKKYLEKLSEKTSKSAKLLLKDPGISRVKELCESGEEHPKMSVLLKHVKQLRDKKAIVFAQYRDQIAQIEKMLQENNIKAKQFVGKKDGFTRKIQEQTINDFRAGLFNILVASSIGEEGLDIPAVDSVIFYEPIPSEIRSIQRRGRAARLKEGEITILVTRGTRDEYYSYASKRKEERMKTILQKMQAKLSGKSDKKTSKKTKSTKTKKKKKSGQAKISDFF